MFHATIGRREKPSKQGNSGTNVALLNQHSQYDSASTVFVTTNRPRCKEESVQRSHVFSPQPLLPRSRKLTLHSHPCSVFRVPSTIHGTPREHLTQNAPRKTSHPTESLTCSTPPPRTSRTKYKTASPPAIHTNPSSRSDDESVPSEKTCAPFRIASACT